MRKIVCKAYGKINLTLDVLGKRADGYHEVLTILQGISLCDQVEIAKGEKGIKLSCNFPQLGTGTDNLAYRAAQLLREDYPQISGLKLHLTKEIPLAAGLAGGSTDAAAVLWGINQLYELQLSLEQLGQYGARLGSDVPFCLEPLTAIGEGRGELIRKCAPAPEIWLVWVKPPFSVTAKEAYQQLAQVKIESRPQTEMVLRGLQEQNKKLIFANIGNVLEYATFALYPQLISWKKEMEELGAEKVMMSGSGPTLLAFFNQKEAAQKLASSYNKPGWNMAVARTTNGEDIEGRVVYVE